MAQQAHAAQTGHALGSSEIRNEVIKVKVRAQSICVWRMMRWVDFLAISLCSSYPIQEEMASLETRLKAAESEIQEKEESLAAMKKSKWVSQYIVGSVRRFGWWVRDFTYSQTMHTVPRTELAKGGGGGDGDGKRR